MMKIRERMVKMRGCAMMMAAAKRRRQRAPSDADMSYMPRELRASARWLASACEREFYAAVILRDDATMVVYASATRCLRR